MIAATTVATLHPVTALAADESAGVLYVGTGGQLIGYDAWNGWRHVQGARPLHLFDADTIHGLKVCRHSAASSSGSETLLLAFGGKALALVRVRRQDGHASPHMAVDVVVDDLDDLVLDCAPLLPDASSQHEQLLVGYAHNFVDVASVGPAAAAAAAAASYTTMRRVHCPEVSVLFSMTIDVRHTQAVVSSGTAFGKIVLWSFDHTAGGTPPSSAVVQEAWTQHEGVIFKMRWSADRARLASVSDDRTVRVWELGGGDSPCRQVFVGWGHVSRLWDVTFLPAPGATRRVGTGETQTPQQEDWLATCSEDGTVRVWDLTRGAESASIAVLRGHASHIWCLALAWVSDDGDAHSTSARHLVLFTGGNDGSVKSWPVAAQVAASALDGEASLVAVPVPSARGGGADAARRSNAASALRVSPDGQATLVVLCDGRVWLVCLAEATSGANTLPDVRRGDADEGSPPPGWYFAADLGRPVVHADGLFLPGGGVPAGDGGFTDCRAYCAHPDGDVTVVHVRARPHADAGIATTTFTPPYVTDRAAQVGVRSWRAHETKTIAAFACPTPEQRRVEGPSPGLHTKYYVLTTSMKGVCRLWHDHIESFDADAGPPHPRSLDLVLEGATGRAHIATCCAVVPSDRRGPDDDGHCFLAVGDSRGGITISNFDNAVASQSGATPLVASVYIPRAHGVDPVSSLQWYPFSGPTPRVAVASTGHDGFLAVHAAADGALLYRLPCLPIKTADTVSFGTSFSHTNQHREASASAGDSDVHRAVVVGGYVGGTYTVWDIHHGYQVARVEGGSWKRAHHAAVVRVQHRPQQCGPCEHIPRAVFVSAAPTAHSTELQIFDSDRHGHTAGPATDAATAGGLHCPRVPMCLLRASAHGKVTYCARFLPEAAPGLGTEGRHVLTAGEDGSVKLFLDRGDGVLSLLQGVHMPGTLPVKALACARAPGGDAGVVVAAGGRLAYALWDAALPSPSARAGARVDGATTAAAPCGPPGQVVLTAAASGSVSPNAGQDHRILCVHVTALPPPPPPHGDGDRGDRGGAVPAAPGDDDEREGSGGGGATYLVVFGDSRGVVTVATYRGPAPGPPPLSPPSPLSPPRQAPAPPAVPNPLTVVDRFSVGSACPVVACDVVLLPIPPPGGAREKRQGQGTGHGEGGGEGGGGGGAGEGSGYLLLGVFGDTTGAVSVCLLAGSRASPPPPPPLPLPDPSSHAGMGGEGRRWAVAPRSQLLACYQAHAMGANALSLAPLPAPRRGQQYAAAAEEEAAAAGAGPTWRVFVASGGDDQAIAGCTVTVALALVPTTPVPAPSPAPPPAPSADVQHGDAPLLQLRVATAFARADCCSSSAIKGIKAVATSHGGNDDGTGDADGDGDGADSGGGGVVLVSVGYDQRLSVWRARRALLHAPLASEGLVAWPLGPPLRPEEDPHVLGGRNGATAGGRQDADGDEADEEDEDDNEEEEEEEGGSGAARWPPESVHAVAAARDALLAWVGGKCVHVGDVGALDVVEARPSPTHAADAGAGVGVPMLAVVAGEGCQVLRIE